MIPQSGQSREPLSAQDSPSERLEKPACPKGDLSAMISVLLEKRAVF
jgi:hypothetical protein